MDLKYSELSVSVHLFCLHYLFLYIFPVMWSKFLCNLGQLLMYDDMKGKQWFWEN